MTVTEPSSAATAIAPSEFADRRAAVARAVRERGLDALVIFSRGGTSADFYGDVMYLSNYHSNMAVIPDSPVWAARGHAAVVVTAGGDAVLLTDYLDDHEDRLRIDDVRVARDLPRALGALLRQLGLAGGALGLAARETLTLHWFRQIEQEAGRPLDVTPADDILETLRLVKSEAELRLMRAAAAVGAGWMTTTLEALAEGRTEANAVAEGLRYLVERGGMPYDVAIASGPKAGHYFGSSGLPHWDSRRPLRRGDLVHVDVWGPVDGYFTDLARSTVLGRRPDDAQREVLEAAVEQVDHITAAVRPGVTCDELCRRGDDWLVEHGFADAAADADGQPAYGHSLYGHSLGLTTERPWIVAGEPTPLRAGMVVAIETVVGRDGVGAANHEQTMVVTDDGPEILTGVCPARWWD